ncbi:uncharacterized protein LOC144469442 isoform X3 [Augochlora pura]
MSACDIHYRFSGGLMKILGIWPYISDTSRRVRGTLVNICCILMVAAQESGLSRINDAKVIRRCKSHATTQRSRDDAKLLRSCKMTIWFFQITPLVTRDFDLTLLLQSLSVVIMVSGSVVKLNAFLYLTSAIRKLMDSIKDVWTTSDKDTLEILEKRAILAKQQGAIYAIFIYPSSLILILYRIFSYIVIILKPETAETFVFPIEMDYLIDEDRYFLYEVIHQCITFFLIATIYVATESLMIMWLQHSISLYELVSFNIEKGTVAGPSYISQKLMDTYRSNFLAKAVNYHTEAKDFMMLMKNKLEFSYAVLLVFAVISLSMNFFRLSVAICETHDIREMVLASFFSTSELVYMFYLNYIIQHLLDYANGLATYTYSTPWYNTSVFIQKQLLIIMTKCSESLMFDFYGFYNASIEGFSGISFFQLVRCTVSYFMMMTSIR